MMLLRPLFGPWTIYIHQPLNEKLKHAFQHIRDKNTLQTDGGLTEMIHNFF